MALDLKFYNGKILLHMIDHATRLSASSIVPNKRPETIVKHMLSNFIQIYGSVESFLSDNGGEFINQSFLELCDLFGIKIKTTAAESPWSNGLVERHNLVLAEMLDKILDDTKCSLEVAVAWANNAKNSLNNVHGFSSFQLALGCNPSLPNVLSDQLPALTNKPKFSIIKENLDALHKAREAFVQSENSEKIRRALSHNIRSSGDVKYVNGDTVYYKRKDSREWHGPAVVLGQDGQQVLVKHGGVYVRVHPCRLNPIKLSSEEGTTSTLPLTSSECEKTDDGNSPNTRIDSESEDDESDNTQTRVRATSSQPENPTSPNSVPMPVTESDTHNTQGNNPISILTDSNENSPSLNIETTNNEAEGRDRTISDLCERLEHSFHDKDGSDLEAPQLGNRSLNSVNQPNCSYSSHSGNLGGGLRQQRGFSNVDANASNFHEGENSGQNFAAQNGDIQCDSYSSSLDQSKTSLPENMSETLNSVKPNQVIQYKNCNDGSWVRAKVLSRAGKASKTSTVPHWWNIEADNAKFSADLSSVDELSILPPGSDHITLISSPEEIQAKNQEIEV